MDINTFRKTSLGWGTDLAKYVKEHFNDDTGFKTFEIYDLITQDQKIADPYKQLIYTIPAPPTLPKKCSVITVKGDTFNVVHNFLRERPNFKADEIAVLNYANGVGVGGGYEHGARAQEEMLFYRSTYNHSLYAAEMYIRTHSLYHKKDFEADKRAKFIPFNRCIVSPRVRVYGRLVNPTTIVLDPSKTYMELPMIAAAAPCFYNIKFNWMDQKQLVANAIYTMWTTIFLTAIIRQTKCLFIGPIGCGMFAPRDNQEEYKALMAQILAKVIQQYKHYFYAIIFADYDPLNIYPNLKIFENVFKEVGFDLGSATDVSCKGNDKELELISRPTDLRVAEEETYNHVPISSYVMKWGDTARSHVSDPARSHDMNDIQSKSGSGPDDVQSNSVSEIKPVGQGFVQSGWLLLWYGTALVSSIIGYTLR
jgi:uncharacterized protein (TIGR02452 family)